MSAFLIFPHQLFKETLAQEADVFYLVESDLFFKQYAFHKQKLIFHRASMRAFADRLRAAGKVVEYIDSQDPRSSEVVLVSSIEGAIRLFDPNDYLLERRLRRAGDIHLLASPNFLNTDTALLGNRKPYFQTAFYTQQRKDRGILLEEDGKPVGGQWTYDSENRKKIPKNTFIPAPFPETVPNAYILEAIDYVSQHFPDNPGSIDMPFSGAYYPVTHEEAQAALDLFIRVRCEQEATLAHPSTNVPRQW
jgi:deoxyribodipyrimidine photolyase-related protein